MNRILVRCAVAAALAAVPIGTTSCGRADTDHSVSAAAEPTSAPTTRVTDPAEQTDGTAAIAGTEFIIPAPPATIGTDQWPLDFGKQPPGDVLGGWSWDKPGSIAGSRAGGVSVTYVSNGVTRTGDPETIARDANSAEATFETRELAGLTLISWPTSQEDVPAGELPVEARPVERYVIVVPDGRFDVVFDATDRADIDAYLSTVAEAVNR